MTNVKTLFEGFISRISLDETKDEIYSIGYLLFEHFFAITKTDIIADKPIQWNTENESLLRDLVSRVNKAEPVQYITGEAQFYERRFFVNSSVLIPRPETEELIRLVISESRALFSATDALCILDIGAGSGCIPVTLKLELPNAQVLATDVSVHALEVASSNAKKLKADVQFIQHDILYDSLPFNNVNIIVSNPPYITFKEKANMKSNVVKYEPHVALFVPDDDPLVFYNAIASKGRKALSKGGMLVVEINERYGKEVVDLFQHEHFKHVEIFKDLSGKERIVKAIKDN